MLEIRNNKMGRGVYTDGYMGACELIEVCPVLLIPTEKCPETLENHVFMWDDINLALALGNGSLYNHSYEPNVIYCRDYDNQQIYFISLKRIPANTELTINYNGDITDKNPMWFKISS